MSSEELDLIEKHLAGKLNPEEQPLFEQRMREDLSFREQVETHQSFLKSLKSYDDRRSLKQVLNKMHQEEEIDVTQAKSVSIRKLWPTIAIAASVALVSATGTLFMARWFDLEHQTNYQELRKNVEKLKKSQTQILENIKANNKKDFPATYIKKLVKSAYAYSLGKMKTDKKKVQILKGQTITKSISAKKRPEGSNARKKKQ